MVVKLDLRTNKQEQQAEQERSPRHYILFSLAALFFYLFAACVRYGRLPALCDRLCQEGDGGGRYRRQ